MQVCKARVIAKSISAVTGKTITTVEAEFPRPILAEFNTHNAISKNSSSSRAVPVPKMLAQVREHTALLARYGAANKGMQDAGVHDALIDYLGSELTPEDFWIEAAHTASFFAETYHEAGYAKQVCNRLIEPFQMMKVVMTATEWNNFFWLRDHGAADPTIEQLAQVIKEAIDGAEAVELQPGEWHTPYYNSGYWKPSLLQTTAGNSEAFSVVVDSFGHTLEHALTISSSCCAQVSFRAIDDTVEKAKGVVAKLNLNGEEPDQPVHASPLEHQGTPIQKTQKVKCNDYGDSKHYFGKDVNQMNPDTWEEGITHMGRDGQFGSGNLWGFIQHRQLVPNHVKRG